MKKRFLSIVLCLLLLSLMPITAQAADHLLDDGESLDISTCMAGDTVTVAAGAHVTLSGSKANLQVFCGAGASVTLSNVTINNSGLSYICPLTFTGSGNALILAAGTTNTLTGSDYTPGVCVPEATVLTISGTGELAAFGGIGSSGIGGNDYSPTCGTVNITNGEITATGGFLGAGIGGGAYGDGGSVMITGGQVTATAGTGESYNNGGAGIGGGDEGSGGSVIISGGMVNATGAGMAAGIGGGNNGSGGIITISGSSTIVNAEGGSNGGACIGSGDGGADGGTITIHGGTVNAISSAQVTFAAAIGGGSGSDCGDITIDGGSVTATGGGPGIGCGLYTGASEGTVIISGGTVIATGNAGIGAGYGGDTDGELIAPDITISGTADVTVTGTGGAGLGGGAYSNAANITITGGVVNATGSFEGAGIGGGCYEDGAGGGGAGTIVISGGIVYASGNDTDDIGNGKDGSGGSLSISGTAAVFMKHDTCLTPVNTLTHRHTTYTEDTEESYGYFIPSSWTPTFGSYLRLVTLSYDTNSGSGTAPGSVTQLYDTTASVSGGSGLSRTYYEFDGWNTAEDGNGTNYASGDTFTFTADTTLFVKWKAQPELISSDDDGIIFVGGRVTLTPNIDGGTWDWDHNVFSATFNSPATFTALRAGISTITYTVDGESATYEVTVEQSNLPNTGQDFSWAWILAGVAGCMGIAAAVTGLKKRAKRV